MRRPGRRYEGACRQFDVVNGRVLHLAQLFAGTKVTRPGRGRLGLAVRVNFGRLWLGLMKLGRWRFAGR